VEDTRFPPDVEVKKGYSWSDQLGIAIASLVESGQKELVNWTKDVCVNSLPRIAWRINGFFSAQILTLVIAQRERITVETDNKDDEDALADEDPDISTVAKMKGPSSEALGKMTDYRALLHEPEITTLLSGRQ
jgi:replication fork protection complex subunit Tof1/Swi1